MAELAGFWFAAVVVLLDAAFADPVELLLFVAVDAQAAIKSTMDKRITCFITDLKAKRVRCCHAEFYVNTKA